MSEPSEPEKREAARMWREMEMAARQAKGMTPQVAEEPEWLYVSRAGLQEIYEDGTRDGFNAGWARGCVETRAEYRRKLLPGVLFVLIGSVTVGFVVGYVFTH